MVMLGTFLVTFNFIGILRSGSVEPVIGFVFGVVALLIATILFWVLTGDDPVENPPDDELCNT